MVCYGQAWVCRIKWVMYLSLTLWTEFKIDEINLHAFVYWHLTLFCTSFSWHSKIANNICINKVHKQDLQCLFVNVWVWVWKYLNRLKEFSLFKNIHYFRQQLPWILTERLNPTSEINTVTSRYPKFMYHT